jgi:hypothetical protein
MECRHIVDDTGFDLSETIAGSYCVHAAYDPDDDDPPGPLCSRDSADPATDCGNNRENP